MRTGNQYFKIRTCAVPPILYTYVQCISCFKNKANFWEYREKVPWRGNVPVIWQNFSSMELPWHFLSEICQIFFYDSVNGLASCTILLMLEWKLFDLKFFWVYRNHRWAHLLKQQMAITVYCLPTKEYNFCFPYIYIHWNDSIYIYIDICCRK